MATLRDLATNDVDFLFTEMGESITYTPAAGEGVVITAIINDRRQTFADGQSGRGTLGEITVRVKESDVTTPGRGDKVTYDSKEYGIERDQAIERGAGSWLIRMVRLVAEKMHDEELVRKR